MAKMVNFHVDFLGLFSVSLWTIIKGVVISILLLTYSKGGEKGEVSGVVRKRFILAD